jgi:shikimate kinase / 3-dehydroquinate synthase
VIVLIGFMGSGKSSVGTALANRLGTGFADTDALIELRAGRSIAELFDQEGEESFRRIERETVLEVLAGETGVIALGGGAVEDDQVRAVLRDKDTVWLRVTADEAIRRLDGDQRERPMLRRGDPAALLELREPLYADASRFEIDTDGRSAEALAEEIARLIGTAPSGAADSVTVPLGVRGYEVWVGNGISAAMFDFVSIQKACEKAFVVTHPSLLELAEPVLASCEKAGLEVVTLVLEEGEHAKSSNSVIDLYERLADGEAHRADLLVAFGGGVVTDVAGFVAATYLRGMPLMNVPTTLLGQVDAAIGGKNGINLGRGKNLVGTIYQPIGVICDLALLRSCPIEEMKSGAAEIVKYGLIANEDLMDLATAAAPQILAADQETLLKVVLRCVQIKADYVAKDETDSSVRAHLNYGHTFAHALETLAGWGRMRHGEAVSIGMMAAAYTAQELGWIDEDAVQKHRRSLESFGLPVTAQVELTDLEQTWHLDKKYRKGVRFVLLRAIGTPEADVNVPRDVLRAALKRLAV